MSSGRVVAAVAVIVAMELAVLAVMAGYCCCGHCVLAVLAAVAGCYRSCLFGDFVCARGELLR